MQAWRLSSYRTRSFRVGLALALVFGLITSVQAAVSLTPGTPTQAVADGRAIALADVARYHCHDLASPLIRCFTTAAARDADEAIVAASLKSSRTNSVTSPALARPAP